MIQEQRLYTIYCVEICIVSLYIHCECSCGEDEPHTCKQAAKETGRKYLAEHEIEIRTLCFRILF
jgi:hypothetical protein